jgi:hypothetical protein
MVANFPPVFPAFAEASASGAINASSRRETPG